MSKASAVRENEILVAKEVENGFQVYSPSDPKVTYLVSGTYQFPNCTCPQFQEKRSVPDFRCSHILAVENQLPEADFPNDDGDLYDASSASSNGAHREAGTMAPESRKAEMVIKRSVSPDGRIDSLSVEFTTGVDNTPIGLIKERAIHVLALQETIIQSFLSRDHDNGENGSNGNGDSHRNSNSAGEASESDCISARLVSVEGMQTRRGYSLYIVVDAGGDHLKLFGDKRQLAEHLETAGYPRLAKQVGKGLRLNVPCRIVTNQNGKYTNIEEVLPTNGRGR